jgi:hypothetical protein
MAVGMVMIAMLVVAVVVVTMVMIVAVMAIALLVRGMTVRRMIMRFIWVRMAGIGATLGVERRFDLDESRAQPSKHCFNHMIAADAQSSCRDLGRQMPIAEVPSETDQMLRIVPPDFKERLGRGHHLDQPAVFEHQRITAAQRHRIFQIEQEFQPTRALHRHPSAVTIVKIEHDAVGRGFATAMLSPHLRGPDHRNMSRKAVCRKAAMESFMPGSPQYMK